MKSPNFCIEARKHAEALASSDFLIAEVITAIFEHTQNGVPAFGGRENVQLRADLKPLKYALYARIITDILQSDDLDVTDPEYQKSVDFFGQFVPEPIGFKKVNSALKKKYGGRLSSYSKAEPEPQAFRALNLMSVILKENDPVISLATGFGTMAHNCSNLLASHCLALETAGLDFDSKEKLLRRSYGDLFEIANNDALRSVAISRTFDEDGITSAMARNGVLKTVNLAEVPISQTVSEELTEAAKYELPAERVAQFRTIGDVANGETVIGCPVLFKRGQIKSLWNEAIDIAIAEGLI